MFQDLINKLEAEKPQSISIGTAEGDDIADVAAKALRVLNVASFELIDHVFKPAFEAYTFEALAEVANDERVKVETELYHSVDELFYAVRSLRNSLPPTLYDELEAFFANNIGKNL